MYMRGGKWEPFKLRLDSCIKAYKGLNHIARLEFERISLYKGKNLVYIKKKFPFPVNYVFHGYENKTEIAPRAYLIDKDAGTPEGVAKLLQAFKDYEDDTP